MTFIGVIGSAGREKPMQWSKALYIRAYHKLQELISDIPVTERKLTSGGAAFADHLAVSTYLADQAHELTLYLPCGFCSSEAISPYTMHGFNQQFPAFRDDGSVDVMSNPGGTLNYYHRKFSTVMGSNTLNGIARALAKGAIQNTSVEFQSGQRLLARNKLTGAVDLLIAFTFGTGSEPADGGTAHCWKYSTAPRKIHIPLGSL